jgi:hypothetical protein
LTGCGCLILVAMLVGGIVFMVFGSTDPGEPVAQIVGVVTALALLWVAGVPIRRVFVRVRGL